MIPDLLQFSESESAFIAKSQAFAAVYCLVWVLELYRHFR